MSDYVRQIRQPDKIIASRLEHLDIELTERCNNDCIHCCINQPAGHAEVMAREMTTAQVEDILRQAADLGCMSVLFTGGEPLIRPDFEQLYLSTRRLGMKVLLYTNACLINSRLTDLFARIPPLEPIEVTVYGMCRESYEAVTRMPGSFVQFRRGVELLQQRRVPFIVKSALLPPNRHEMAAFEAWATTIPWMTRPPRYSMLFELRSRHDDAVKNSLIKSLRPSPQDVVAVLTRDEPVYRKEMISFASKFMRPSGSRLFACGACHGLSIDAYGCAQPCMGIRMPVLTCAVAGASGRRSLREALDSFANLGELHATNPDYLKRCAVCILKGLCEQCPSKSLAEHGNLDTPVEYLCEVAHAQARNMGWLDKNHQGWEVHNK
jgi:MoaA/NifB/PqqE/SkfB family radical SAM enzyme